MVNDFCNFLSIPADEILNSLLFLFSFDDDFESRLPIDSFLAIFEALVIVKFDSIGFYCSFCLSIFLRSIWYCRFWVDYLFLWICFWFTRCHFILLFFRIWIFAWTCEIWVQISNCFFAFFILLSKEILIYLGGVLSDLEALLDWVWLWFILLISLIIQFYQNFRPYILL